MTRTLRSRFVGGPLDGWDVLIEWEKAPPAGAPIRLGWRDRIHLVYTRGGGDHYFYAGRTACDCPDEITRARHHSMIFESGHRPPLPGQRGEVR